MAFASVFGLRRRKLEWVYNCNFHSSSGCAASFNQLKISLELWQNAGSQAAGQPGAIWLHIELLYNSVFHQHRISETTWSTLVKTNKTNNSYVVCSLSLISMDRTKIEKSVETSQTLQLSATSARWSDCSGRGAKAGNVQKVVCKSIPFHSVAVPLLSEK